jgi:hypothetical protein
VNTLQSHIVRQCNSAKQLLDATLTLESMCHRINEVMQTDQVHARPLNVLAAIACGSVREEADAAFSILARLCTVAVIKAKHLVGAFQPMLTLAHRSAMLKGVCKC